MAELTINITKPAQLASLSCADEHAFFARAVGQAVQHLASAQSLGGSSFELHSDDAEVIGIIDFVPDLKE